MNGPEGYARVQDKVMIRVLAELNHAMATYPAFNSAHEGYAVIKEELDELWDEIKRSPKNRNEAQLEYEAVQLAAMALRFLIDCGITYKVKK